ncbi:MAG: hypothetical protein AAFW70_12935 [Cyanobacteria bacterium J06635_10]
MSFAITIICILEFLTVPIDEYHPNLARLMVLEFQNLVLLAIKSLHVPWFYVFGFDSCPENPAMLNPDTAIALPLAAIIVIYRFGINSKANK